MRSPTAAATRPAAPPADPQRPGYFVMGAGAPVVLLHASLGSKSQWSTLAERLARRFQVIAIDLWGYGDHAGSALPTPFSLDEEVRLVMDRLDALVDARTRVHVVGHSYGGLVALRLAQWHRQRIASLALYEPVLFRLLDERGPDRVGITRLAQHVARLVTDGSPRDAARVFVDFWNGDGAYDALPLPVQQNLAQRAGKIPLDFAAAASWPHDARDLRAIIAPVLLMIGNRGPALGQRIVDRLATLLPDVRVAPFDCGHLGPVTNPERINPWIDAFIDLCAERAAARSPARPADAPVRAPLGADARSSLSLATYRS